MYNNNYNKENKYESSVVPDDLTAFQDTNIDPKSFLYRQIFYVQKCLNNNEVGYDHDKMKAVYIMNVELLKVFSLPIDLDDKKFEDQINKFKLTKEYIEAKEKDFKLATYKLSLLLNHAFGARAIYSPVKS